jgi:hypothetical protein
VCGNSQSLLILQAEAIRVAAQSAEESQGLLQALQQDAAQHREAAIAAAAEADAERRAATEARAGAARRIEELETALAAALQEAASSHRAAEDAVEALEAADARAAWEKEERGDSGAGLTQALERTAAAEERCRESEAEVGSLQRRVRIVQTFSCASNLTASACKCGDACPPRGFLLHGSGEEQRLPQNSVHQ